MAEVLLLGANGFVGRRLTTALRQKGNRVDTPSHRDIDFENFNKGRVEYLLEGCDTIINCVGVMHRNPAILNKVHYETPLKIAEIAVKKGVKRWIQISALGATENSKSEFLKSKAKGDNALCDSGLDVAVVRPSIIYGRNSRFIESLLKMLNLPFVALPNNGEYKIQPVHIDDLVAAIGNLLEQQLAGQVIDCTGSEEVTFAHFCQILREKVLGKPAIKIVNLPEKGLKPILPMTNILTNGFVSSDSLQMLEHGSCADNSLFRELLGKDPQGVEEFVLYN
ncbi:MAG: NAD-dependent epimerase/dehydratase family protein [Cardiobacteriaceae bacterium]|nr:NAD-dependent epimerase/dehydratase family protein [Cardiobacteriaceae bacterium]